MSPCLPRRKASGAPCKEPRRRTMHAFQYHRPSSTKDAISLATSKGEGKYLAGGQSLVQAMKLRLSSPSDLIDLGSLKELAGIKTSGGSVEIGAMTRHAD